MYEEYNTCLVKMVIGKSISKRQEATGSIIKFNNIVLVATAAHCIFDIYDKKFYEDIICSFWKDKFEKKYKVKKAFIPKRWIEEGALECDTAFVLLDTFDCKEYMNYAITPKFNLQRELDYAVMGFSGKTVFSSKSPITISGKAVLDEKYKFIVQGIECKNKNGMSGGPWLTSFDNEVVQNSVSSFSFRKKNKLLWGPYWGREIENVLYVACGIRNNSSKVITKEYI